MPRGFRLPRVDKIMGDFFDREFPFPEEALPSIAELRAKFQDLEPRELKALRQRIKRFFESGEIFGGPVS